MLQRRAPELKINTWVDGISENDLNGAQIIATEMNNRYEIYIRLRDELEKAKANIAMRERAAALVAALVLSAPPKEKESAKQRKEQNCKIQELLDSIDVRGNAEARAEIESMAQSCLKVEDPVRVELLVTDLRVRINRLNRTVRDEQCRMAELRDKDAAEARDYIQRLGVLGCSAEGTLREDLLRVSSGDAIFTDDIRKNARTAIAAAEQGYAGIALKETLEQLGYEVQSGFKTLFAQGGSSFFQRPSWSEYHCRLTVDSQRQHLNFDMVRYGSGGEESMEAALRDKEMEQKWCQEVPRLLDRLARKGLTVNLTRKLAPGIIALQVIDDDRLKPVNNQYDMGTKDVRERSF
jgi:hypothetical protein